MTALGVMTVERTCEECGAVIPPQTGSARPRKYCVKCRPPRNRPNPRVIPMPDQAATSRPAQAPAAGEEPALVASYRKVLEQADRASTPDGMQVLLLAQLLAVGPHTAAGAASLSRELRAAMEVALRDAPRQADELDELQARRIAKAANA